MNKTMVITGAASGIGKAFALEGHARGYNLALLDINLDGLIDLQYKQPGWNHGLVRLQRLFHE